MIESTKSKRASRFKGSEQEGASRQTPLVPLNENQRLYINALKTSCQVIALGPSGTGKTWIPAVHAANLYAKKSINKIIITRPSVSVGRTLGALPGTLEEKFSPWLSPILTTLEECLGKGVVETGIKNGNIVLSPLEYMRGSSFNNAYVLLDESQNLSVEQAKMFVTRIGENCTLVMTGDVRQKDIDKADGLSKIVHLAKKYHIDATVIEFTIDDVVRSDVCKAWLEAFYEEGL